MILNKKLLTMTIVATIIISMPFCSPEKKKNTETELGELAEEPKSREEIDPNAPAQTCYLSATEFATWFSDGTVSANGMVNSANSLSTFDTTCDFYKWSWQMFLWNFSPNAGSYVYDTSPFFDVEGSTLVRDGIKTRVRGGKVDQEGQAGLVSGVLMSQQAGVTPDGSIVYYAVHVNDVYAYMVSGQKTGQLNLTQFPTTQDELDMIKEYAQNVHNVDIQDGESLAMELKSSWIKIPDGADASQYITVTASVPNFVKNSDTEWVWDGTSFENNVTLALVGYHVVGSAAGHPEMIWATFEHSSNAPDVDYYYVNNEGKITEKKTYGEDDTPIRKDWTFADGTAKLNSSNQMHMELEGNKIEAEPHKTISPSSTVRTHPWGNISDETSAINNTQIISLNNNVTDMLLDGDLRKNYFLVGATWTTNGVPGVGNQLPEVKGSKVLANATMETYFQYKNCFSCHQGGRLTGLSHIYGGIDPLPAR